MDRAARAGLVGVIRSALALALLLSACGEEPARVDREERSEPPPVRAMDGEEPAPSRPPAPSPPAELPRSLAEAPASGCTFGAPRRISAGAEWAAIAAADGAFVVAGSALEGARERVSVARVELDGSARVLASGTLEHPVPRGHRRASPALAVRGEALALVLVDGARRVMLGELALGGSELAWRAVGEGGSLRFAPAIAPLGQRWALAWTVEEAESLGLRAALAGASELSAARALRPPGGGSAAPRFVRGAGGLTLVFLDPRAGVSVAHRAAVSERGFADPSVARPLNLVAEPPEIAVVRAGEHEWIGYTAVGSAATTAVGLARLGESAPAVPLVPGTGYGALHVDVASLDDGRAVFVADAPQGSAPDAPRELHVRVLASDGALGEPAIVRASEGTAARGRIAHAGGGVVAVVFTGADGAHAAIGRCAAAR